MNGQEQTPAAEPVKSMVGEVVIFTDATGREQLALVTADWSHPTTPRERKCINVVVVSLDESKTDTYGRQVERFTSVQGKSEFSAPGLFWTDIGTESGS